MTESPPNCKTIVAIPYPTLTGTDMVWVGCGNTVDDVLIQFRQKMSINHPTQKAFKELLRKTFKEKASMCAVMSLDSTFPSSSKCKLLTTTKDLSYFSCKEIFGDEDD